jgi:hypothetical protein
MCAHDSSKGMDQSPYISDDYSCEEMAQVVMEQS